MSRNFSKSFAFVLLMLQKYHNTPTIQYTYMKECDDKKLCKNSIPFLIFGAHGMNYYLYTCSNN